MNRRKLMKTHNGKIVVKDDIQHAFSILKAVYKWQGYQCSTSMYNATTKQRAIEKLMELVEEVGERQQLLTTLGYESREEQEVEEVRIDERAKFHRIALIGGGILFAIGFTVGQLI